MRGEAMTDEAFAMQDGGSQQSSADSADVRIRPMKADDREAVAELIHVSTNYWYEANGRGPIFGGGPELTRLFFDVYEALDPGQALVAENGETGRLMGSCFVHPRPTHVSLGIMNVHPGYFGRGVGGKLLRQIVAIADEQDKPLRLVSSAFNLDSYSLYTRCGFVPRALYQDMLISVPEAGMAVAATDLPTTRDAVPKDLAEITALEREVAGIERPGDWEYFVENREGFWGLSVSATDDGEIQGVMASCGHPGCCMLGPGAARTADVAAGLLLHELNRRRGLTAVCLIPAESGELVQRLYSWGARNCEIHVSQVRGESPPVRGFCFPTFMPESA